MNDPLDNIKDVLVWQFIKGPKICKIDIYILFDVIYTNPDFCFIRSIVVRHPLERVLSAYRYTLKDTTLMPDINKKAFEFWLNKRFNL